MKTLLVLLLLVAAVHASFVIEQVDVSISDIESDGSAKVHESIKIIMFGDHSNSVYDSGIAYNRLSVWSNNTGLKDVKIHVNSALVDIRDFRLRPQPRTKCNPIQELCHGELILDYYAYPSFENESAKSGTGLFTVEKYKPRTHRYTLNPDALSFTLTTEKNIILEDEVHLTIKMPAESELLDVNPQPGTEDLGLPAHVSQLSWNDIVLVKFSLIFDVEDSIDKEVTDFFSNIAKGISSTLSSPNGIPLVVLILLLIGSYLYIMMAKRRGEE